MEMTFVMAVVMVMMMVMTTTTTQSNPSRSITPSPFTPSRDNSSPTFFRPRIPSPVIPTPFFSSPRFPSPDFTPRFTPIPEFPRLQRNRFTPIPDPTGSNTPRAAISSPVTPKSGNSSPTAPKFEHSNPVTLKAEHSSPVAFTSENSSPITLDFELPTPIPPQNSRIPSPATPIPDFPSPEFPNFDIPSPEFPKFEFPSPEFTPFEIPHPEFPHFEIPSPESPNFDIPRPQFPQGSQSRPELLSDPQFPSPALPNFEIPSPDSTNFEIPSPDSPNKDEFATFDLIDLNEMGESIPTLFHKLINGGLEIPGEGEGEVDDGEQDILAAVIQSDPDEKAEGRSEPTEDLAKERKSGTEPIQKKSAYPKKSLVLLRRKKQELETHKVLGPISPGEPGRTREKRFTKYKLRSIVVPLSVFNFLGFLPVRVPGLPYHDDLPSPDYSYYDTTYEVYVPDEYRRRKSYRY